MATIRKVEGKLYEFIPSPGAKAAATETANSLFNKALQAKETKRPADEILDLYNQALAKNPQLPGVLVNIAVIEIKRRNYDLAEDLYRKALAIDPNYPLVHYNLAHFLDGRWKRAEALVHYRRAIELKPDYADAHYNIALDYSVNGDYLEALKHWHLYLRYGVGQGQQWRATAKREIARLQNLLIVPKPTVAEKAQVPVVDSQAV